MGIEPYSRRERQAVTSRGRVPVSPPRRVALVAVPPVRTLDVFGPAEVFADANHLNHWGPAYDVQILSATEDRTVASYLGVPLVADRTYREMRQPVDTLLVAGGEGAQQMRYSPKFLEWLRRQSSKARRYGSSKSSRSSGLGRGQSGKQTFRQRSCASSGHESTQFCPHIPRGNRRNPGSAHRDSASGGGSPATRNDRLVARRSRRHVRLWKRRDPAPHVFP